MSGKLIYKAIWIFLILITKTYEILRLFLKKIHYFFINILYSKKSSQSITYNDILCLEECNKNLTKIPKHLGVIMASEKQMPSEVLAKLAVYSLIADIDYISFYDPRRAEGITLDEIEIPQYISAHKMQNGRLIWSMPTDRRKAGLLKYRNGLEKSIEVINICNKQGKPLLTEICRELHAKSKTNEMQDILKNKRNLTEKINDIVKKKLDNLPDPDIAIVFGKFMCTFGFMPWHTGFTEFHLIKDETFFNVEEFTNILYRFSKCEQRFGK